MDLETTIVGAGPYGLSIAANLRAAGIPFEIFGSPLESWRRFMPARMQLKSECFASNLWDPHRRFTLKRYCETRGIPYRPVGTPLPLALFLEYAEWFRHNAVGEPRELKIDKIRAARGGFTLHLADGGVFNSRRVVLATGHMAFQVMPPVLAQLSGHRVLHSTGLDNETSYAGRDVVVIGAGQSALETAGLLHEAGARVRVLARRSRIEWNDPSKPRSFLQRILSPDAGVASGWKSFAVSELPRVFRWYFPPAKRHRFVAGSYGPSGAWWLRDRVEGRIEIWLNSTVAAATPEDDRIALRVDTPSGTRDIRADHVVAATGFRVDIDRLGYLDTGLAQSITREAGGIPALDSHFETSVPGLFIVGLASAPVFGPIMRFMYGAKHVGPVLVNRLRRRDYPGAPAS